MMTEYLLVYLGGNPPASPEEGKKHFARYKEWLGSLGDAVVSPANPLKNTRTIESDGRILETGSTTMSGYTIVQAQSMDEALKMGQACPFLETGGSLEVSELIKMQM